MQDVIDGTWESHQFWGGLETGVVGLAQYSPLVLEPVRQKAKWATNHIVNAGFNAFCGPVRDEDALVVIAEGECIGDTDMLNMSWLVEGVLTPGEHPPR